MAETTWSFELFYVFVETSGVQDVYMSNMAGVLLEAGTVFISRTPEFTPGFFGGVRVVHLFNFLCFPFMCLYVLSVDIPFIFTSRCL